MDNFLSILQELARNPLFWFLILQLLLLLLSRLLKRRNRNSGGFGSGSGMGDSHGSGMSYEESLQASQEARERAVQARAVRIGQMLENASPTLKAFLTQAAGMGHVDLKNLQDENQVRRIAERLDDDVVDVLELVPTQELDFDVGTSTELIESGYPADDIDVAHVDDLAADDIQNILPEEWAQGDDVFYARLASGETRALQHLAEQTEDKQGYVLLDVSGSMDQPTKTGIIKHKVARAATLKLLSEVIDKGSKFWLRFFDGRSHSLIKATTKNEALRALKTILDKAFSGGGTNIVGALQQAISDIRSNARVAVTHILLISDGEDGALNQNLELLVRLLGDDIKLHVIMVGNDNTALQQIATSYKRID